MQLWGLPEMSMPRYGCAATCVAVSIEGSTGSKREHGRVLPAVSALFAAGEMNELDLDKAVELQLDVVLLDSPEYNQ